MAAAGPFPGMDPWLEDSWSGVHTSLITYACDQLQAHLKSPLIAFLKTRNYREWHFDEPPLAGRPVRLHDTRTAWRGRPVTLAQTRLETDRSTAAAPYHISVWRQSREQTIEYYPLSLRSALPTIGIPLRESDDDAPLDLQALVEQTYRNGRYAEVIDYSKPPFPPLKGTDVAWSKKLIAQWRKRSA